MNISCKKEQKQLHHVVAQIDFIAHQFARELRRGRDRGRCIWNKMRDVKTCSIQETKKLHYDIAYEQAAYL